MTTTKEKIMGYTYFFFIKRRAKPSNHWHGAIEPNSNWKPNDYLPLTWKVILTSEPWNCFIQRLVLLKGISVLSLIYSKEILKSKQLHGEKKTYTYTDTVSVSFSRGFEEHPVVAVDKNGRGVLWVFLWSFISASLWFNSGCC